MKIIEINEFTYLKKSKIHNNGVFALKFIPKGTRLMEYTGELVSKEEGTKRCDLSHAEHKKNPNKGAIYIFDIDEENDLDGDTPDNYAKFINHSCETNCEYEQEGKKIFVQSTKDINKDEELTINYGFTWGEEDYFEHPCKCGSKNCVGYILDEDDWPKLKEHLKKKKQN
jgi:uncharacterized protein